MNLRIIELVFEGTPLLDRQGVRLATELVSHPEGEKEEKDKKGVKLIIMRENHKTLMEKVSNWQSKDKW